MSRNNNAGDGIQPAETPTGAETYRRLLSYAKPHWRRLVVASVCMVGFAMTDAAFAALMQPLLDGGFSSDSGRAPWVVPLAVLALFFFRGVAGFISTYQMEWVGGRVIAKLRAALFDKYLSLPTAHYDQTTGGELISRLTYNVQMVSNAASKAITVLIRDSITVIALLSLMAWHSWRLTLAFMLVGPLLGILIAYVSRRFRRISRNIQTAMGDLTHVAEEAIEGQREVKVFGGQAHERARFEIVNEHNFRLNLKETATRAASAPLIHFLVAVALAIIMYYASLQGTQSHLSVGEFVSFLTAMLLLFQPLKALSDLNAVIQRGIAAGESVFSLLDEASEPDTGRDTLMAPITGIRFNDVQFKYASAPAPVVSGISFEMGAGETVALVGRSGSGKTTLAQLLARLYEMDAGEIQVNGKDLRQFSLASLRAQIAYVGQQVTLFNDTVAANIAYGVEAATPEMIERAAKAANAHEFISQMADGYDTWVGDNGVLLSGGQRQRIAIARALLKQCPILILDEATSALDAESERLVQDGLNNLMRDRTTMVIAHRLSTIENADRILVLEKGRLLESGKHRELLASGGHYAKLHGLQFSHES
ncbi:MAG: lipid A export permease/ATP-binding protein MsbA [Granulosicoccaceae bacterium]